MPRLSPADQCAGRGAVSFATRRSPRWAPLPPARSRPACRCRAGSYPHDRWWSGHGGGDLAAADRWRRCRLPEGLNIEWVKGSPGQVQLQLATGAANVGVFGALGIAEIAPRGSDIVIFAPALNNHGRWIVRDNSSYQSPRDLVGKTIATQHEGSDTYRHARLAALLQGIDLKKDVKVVFGSPTANVALFERGDVDAVITIEPTATRLVARGAREIARVGDMWREATGDDAPLFLIGFAAHREWAEKNRRSPRRSPRYSSICIANCGPGRSGFRNCIRISAFLRARARRSNYCRSA